MDRDTRGGHGVDSRAERLWTVTLGGGHGVDSRAERLWTVTLGVDTVWTVGRGACGP